MKSATVGADDIDIGIEDVDFGFGLEEEEDAEGSSPILSVYL